MYTFICTHKDAHLCVCTHSLSLVCVARLDAAQTSFKAQTRLAHIPRESQGSTCQKHHTLCIPRDQPHCQQMDIIRQPVL